MPRGPWATALLLVVTGATAPAAAQPLAPVGPPPALSSSLDQLPPSVPVRGSAPVDHPPSILGAPIAVRGEPVRPPVDPLPPAVSGSAWAPASIPEPPAVQKTTRAAGLGAPMATGSGVTTAAGPVSAATVESRVRQAGATTPPPTDPVNDFLARRSGYKADSTRDGKHDSRPSWKLEDRVGDVLGPRGEWFRSDHAFDGFISPVSNPFLFEDPRSLTEIRPIFISQRIPGKARDFNGGHVTFFGTQARLAITDRLSFTINKLGGVWFSTGGGSPFSGDSGFSELWFGPKYTFIRNEQTGSLLAGGLLFQTPVGSPGVFQNTGGLSLVPYATYGQNLFRDFRFGSFNFLANGGYSFATSKSRSDYLYLNAHLDMDVMNWHRIYPLVEMNWFVNTSNGTANPIGIEGRDLINFGGQAKGTGLLTGAIGVRGKITESAQIGTAFEVPLAGRRDLFDYRFTVDFILRY
ncbi:MAG: hypothetical protein JWO38_1995 [Gemmataceae bacterium]|nr:hypothetical protein [Gemmataceae bacterium]